MSSQKAKRGNEAISFWKAFRDIFVEAIKRGQILPVGAVLALLLMILKTPEEFMPKLWGQLYGDSLILTISALLNIILLIAWTFHAKHQRRIAAREFEEIAAARNKAQSSLIEIQTSKVR